jgi:hypothetical protein
MSTKPHRLDTFPTMTPGDPLAVPGSPKAGEGPPELVLRPVSEISSSSRKVFLISGLS